MSEDIRCDECGYYVDETRSGLCEECWDVSAEVQHQILARQTLGLDTTTIAILDRIVADARLEVRARAERYRHSLAPLAKVEPVETEVELLEAESF